MGRPYIYKLINIARKYNGSLVLDHDLNNWTVTIFYTLFTKEYTSTGSANNLREACRKCWEGVWIVRV